MERRLQDSGADEEMAGEVLIYVKTAGKVEKDVMNWVEVVRSIKDAVDDFEKEEVVERFKELGKLSKELHRWLRLKTEGGGDKGGGRRRQNWWYWRRKTKAMG